MRQWGVAIIAAVCFWSGSQSFHASIEDARAAGMGMAADSVPDGYHCPSDTARLTWQVSPGFRASILVDQGAGLRTPVALAIAGGEFGGLLYAVNQGMVGCS